MRKRQFVPVFVIGVICAATTGCGGGGGGSTGPASGAPVSASIQIVPPGTGSTPGSNPPATTSLVSGTLVNSITHQPMSGVTISILSNSAVTDASGDFSLSGIPTGTQTITLQDSLDTVIASTQVSINGSTDPLGTLLFTAAGNPPPAPTI